jgi:hypothetical protein
MTAHEPRHRWCETPTSRPRPAPRPRAAAAEPAPRGSIAAFVLALLSVLGLFALLVALL